MFYEENKFTLVLSHHTSLDKYYDNILTMQSYLINNMDKFVSFIYEFKYLGLIVDFLLDDISDTKARIKI